MIDTIICIVICLSILALIYGGHRQRKHAQREAAIDAEYNARLSDRVYEMMAESLEYMQPVGCFEYRGVNC